MEPTICEEERKHNDTYHDEILEEFEATVELCKVLMSAESRLREELVDARKELISGLVDSGTVGSIPNVGFRALRGGAGVGIKMMGKLEVKPFAVDLREKYPPKEASAKAVQLCSMWQDYVGDISWHPFKVIGDQETTREVIDENDERIKRLKNECGKEGYEAVINALREINECDPNGRSVLPELWNFEVNRKASLLEGVQYILSQWKLCSDSKG